jgi:hypothetical protein
MPPTTTDANRFRLLHGPYQSPNVEPGQTLRCEIRGRLTVGRFSKGRIPWPISRGSNQGGGSYIICGDLSKAIRCESSLALHHWFGVGTATVSNWRRALGIPAYNEGTLRLWSFWKMQKLPRPCEDEVFPFNREKMRARRLELGLIVREVAERADWNSLNSYGQYEDGRRRHATKATLTRIAKALECPVEDLIESDGQAVS